MIAQQVEKTAVATPATQTLIKVANLRKSYTTGEVTTEVLQGITMQLPCKTKNIAFPES